MAVFDADDDRHLYLYLVKMQTERYGVEILAWCLMTNHVHFIAIPDETSSLARAFGEAHRLYTRRKNIIAGTKGYLFQGRFNSCVLDQRHLLAATRYVEQNPVRAKMAGNPWDYVWSSARFHVGMSACDILVQDKTLRGLVKDWKEFIANGDDHANEQVRAGVRVGRPMGDSSFVESIQVAIGRDLSKGKPGRHPKQK